MTEIRRQRFARVCQGDIYKDIEFIEYVAESQGVIECSKVIFPLVIVLTQDCDLEQDYKFRWSRKDTKNQDKWLISVLVAPLYNVEHIYRGEHLSELGMEMLKIKKKGTKGNNIRINVDPRYHYLEFPGIVQIVPSVIDFKHYFSVNVNYLKTVKKSNFICRVAPLFREDIAQRFAAFLSRIGLPLETSV